MTMSVEEKALRYADSFFTDESKWERRENEGEGLEGSLCVGRALMRGRACAPCTPRPCSRRAKSIGSQIRIGLAGRCGS